MAEKEETLSVVIQNAPEPEKKKFEIPSIEEVVASIKELDDEIEHISLNLIKCNFQAVQNDVRKAFPEYKDKLLKVKQYKPGSFELVFQSRMDAIEFTRNAPGKKILGRIFLIKLGRNFKSDKQDWVYVEGGNDKKRHGHGYHNKGKNYHHQQHKPTKQEGEESPAHQKKEEHHEEKQKVTQFKQETVEDKKQEKKTIDSKYIPLKTEKPKEQHKNKEPKEFYHPQVRKESSNIKPAQPVETKQRPAESKTQPTKPAAKETKPKNEKPKEKEAPKKEVKEEQKTKDEDDGWIVVTKKGKK